MGGQFIPRPFIPGPFFIHQASSDGTLASPSVVYKYKPKRKGNEEQIRVYRSIILPRAVFCVSISSKIFHRWGVCGVLRFSAGLFERRPEIRDTQADHTVLVFRSECHRRG